ncbi:KAP family P-loop NTPase fold protein [Candidatus Endomicrobiellum trichonymphae]|uniref:KAP family P-loop NTPase fold protein n=1 Tax=Endomicrobium trichonymphae TaxID=1408204 RepID=UPI00155180B1|nr:P-loop NTPase fold protein [Candidatus Endomicrobium trichonymphae]
MTDNQTLDEKIQIKQDDCKKEIFNADKDKKDDILGRIRFAENMSLRLLNYKADESVIIGLNGEWGSGKSSVINLIKQCINNNNDNAGKPAIINFNPWTFSKREDITRYFFDEISSAFDYKNRSEEDKATAEKFRSYAKLLGALEYVPNSSVFLFSKFLKNIFKRCEKYCRKSENVSIMGIKNELNDRLIKNKRNTIVFIDDIDRLTNKEIREIFRLVRVNADFWKMIYVIAFDRHIVEKSFEEQGKEYLENIIQVNVNVPFPSKEGLSQFLCKELDRVIKTLPASVQELFQ